MFIKNYVFLTIHYNPTLAYIGVRDIYSSQRNASVQSLLLAGNYLYKQKGEGEVVNFREFLGKKTQYLMDTLYLRLQVTFFETLFMYSDSSYL